MPCNGCDLIFHELAFFPHHVQCPSPPGRSIYLGRNRVHPGGTRCRVRRGGGGGSGSVISGRSQAAGPLGGLSGAVVPHKHVLAGKLGPVLMQITIK